MKTKRDRKDSAHDGKSPKRQKLDPNSAAAKAGAPAGAPAAAKAGAPAAPAGAGGTAKGVCLMALRIINLPGGEAVKAIDIGKAYDKHTVLGVSIKKSRKGEKYIGFVRFATVAQAEK